MSYENETSNQTHNTLSGSVILLIKTLASLFSDIFKVATLEAQLASLSLVNIIGLILGIGLLAFTLWILLQAGFAAWLIGQGYSWSVTLFSIAGINLILMLIMFFFILAYRKNLAFPATRRQLQKIQEK